MKVLITDGLSEKGIEILKKGGLAVDLRLKLSHDALMEVISEYDALIVRSATKVTSDIINAADKLRVIGRAGIGVDNIDVDAATRKGIVVMNTPGGNTITAAEHTLALMFAIARRIHLADSSMKSGRWEKGRFMGVELYGKTLGIIGLGNIGSVVADRAHGLRMKVIAYDPYITEEAAEKMGVELVSFEELLKNSDFITIHTPLTSETRNLINARTIGMMKRGVYIINCARGGIVNEKDLMDAISKGHVAGAALDVFEKEPPDDWSLVRMEQVVTTPHLGASTEEAQEKVSIAIAEQIVDFLKNDIVRNAVNVPSIPKELYEALKPYILLAEKMGSFQAQLLTRAASEIWVEFIGDVANQDVTPITISLLKGFFSIFQENVNYVNAPLIAKERGVKVIESKSSKTKDFASLINLRVKTIDDKEHLVAGALFGKADPRIVRINDFMVEAIPKGFMIVMQNYDRPGVIGSVGTLLGKREINIAGMQLGRKEIGGVALSLITVDNIVTEEILDELKRLPNIIDARLVKL